MKPHNIGHGADAPEAISVYGIRVALDATRLTAAVVGVQLDVVAVGKELAEAFLIGLRPIPYGLHDQPHVAELMCYRSRENDRWQAPKDGHTINDSVDL